MKIKPRKRIGGICAQNMLSERRTKDWSGISDATRIGPDTLQKDALLG